MAQDRLRYLTTNATAPLLVDAFDPTSRQRVYAIGHSYHICGRSFPAPEEIYGPPTRLGAIPLRGEAHHPRYPVRLVDQLRRASRVGCEWPAIRLGTDWLGWLLTPDEPARPRTARPCDNQVALVGGTRQLVGNSTRRRPQRSPHPRPRAHLRWAFVVIRGTPC
jgi:hypothetical protein